MPDKPETCETCNGYETVMRKFDDGGASLGNESIPCPTCCEHVAELRARVVPDGATLAWHLMALQPIAKAALRQYQDTIRQGYRESSDHVGFLDALEGIGLKDVEVGWEDWLNEAAAEAAREEKP